MPKFVSGAATSWLTRINALKKLNVIGLEKMLTQTMCRTSEARKNDFIKTGILGI